MTGRRLGPGLAAMLILGGVLYAGEAWLLRPAAAPEAFGIPAAELTQRVEQWTARHGRAPSEVERAQLEAELVDEELLFRHGLGLGLDGSAIARQRLLDLADFLEVADVEGGDPEALIAAARELGVHLRDPVIRRHVVQAVRLAAIRAAPDRLPSEAELRNYLESQSARFERPARVELTHVFLSETRRGERAQEDALALFESLASRPQRPDAAARSGDLFPLGARIPLRSESELARSFGGELAERVMALPTRQWSEPLRSTYGWHLVWVHEQVSARVPPLAAIRSEVFHRYLRDRGEERLEELLAALRERYRVRIGAAEDA